MEDYLNWKGCNGTQHHERADPTTNIFEKNIIETRYDWAISRLKKHRATNVLDVGCGLGYGTNLIFEEGLNVEGIDISGRAIDVCRVRYPHIKFLCAEFPFLTFDTKYDAIVANEVIEHVKNYKEFIRGCVQALNDNGVLLLTTPNRKYSKNRNPHHIHEFTPKEIRELLPCAKMRAISTCLFKGQRLLLFFLTREHLQRLHFFFSKLPIICQMPSYARYFSIEVLKNKTLLFFGL